MLPDGLKDIMPTVTPGWTITTSGSEIDWTGGSIPSGQRADFTFRAQVPASPTTLKWKAYQTYSDGSVVSWDQDPVPGHEEDDSMTPYSQTTVINDLTPSPTPETQSSNSSASTAETFAIVALALSAVSLGIVIRKR
jgi:periplasmic copper chaperone A